MDTKEIKNLGKKLKAFLKQFDDCFCRSQPRGHRQTYVKRHLSNLQHKSAEPIALVLKRHREHCKGLSRRFTLLYTKLKHSYMAL